MSLSDTERATLVGMYLDKAKATLYDARLAAEAERWSMAANRLYYSVFHAATALFVNDGLHVSSHRGVKAMLGKHYILTGKMSSEHSVFLAQMETLRDKADYNIMFVAKREDVVPNLQAAESFLAEVEMLISNKTA